MDFHAAFRDAFGEVGGKVSGEVKGGEHSNGTRRRGWEKTRSSPGNTGTDAGALIFRSQFGTGAPPELETPEKAPPIPEGATRVEKFSGVIESSGTGKKNAPKFFVRNSVDGETDT